MTSDMSDMVVAAPKKVRVAIFGTHPKQFNGYSKVVYELCKAMCASKPDVEMHVFGFQNFHNHPGHRNDVPRDVHVYDAHAEETPKAAGFGVPLARGYVTRVRPDVVVIFNDLMVLTSVLNEVKDAPNRKDFKIIAYVDQVYLCQRKDFLAFVNQHADAVIAFTPEWKDCIVKQGIRLPTYYLPHGFNPRTYFPIPKELARRHFGISPKDFLVLNLNRNQPRKRWDTCMQAFAEVVRRLPDAPVKLAIGTDLKGAWDLKELYERELVKRGVPVELGMSRLVIPGHPQMLTDEETNILYNIADIGINTCDGEGFGLCNFEQAAMGIPQVIPRLGGFVHIFDTSYATLVEPKLSLYVDATRDGVGGEAQLSCADDFADAIVRYYEDRKLMAEHGRRGREVLRERFSWDKIADRFHAILRSVYPSWPQPSSFTATTATTKPSGIANGGGSGYGGGGEVVEKDVFERVILGIRCAPPSSTEEAPVPTSPSATPPAASDAPLSKTANAADGLSASDAEELRQLKARIDAILNRR